MKKAIKAADPEIHIDLNVILMISSSAILRSLGNS
jgi:hypothetical protein